MSVLDRPELVPVSLGYCPCEGTPHADGDTVYLHPELSMSGGMAAQGAISEASTLDAYGNLIAIDEVQLQELIAMVWIRHGVAGWTFLDDLGAEIPVTDRNVSRALPYAKGGRLVADKADDLYGAVVTAPLVEKMDALLKRLSTRTPPPTSENRATRRSRRKPSSTGTTDKALPAA